MLGLDSIIDLGDFFAVVNEPDFCCHSEISHWSVNHVFVDFLFEQILLKWTALFPFLEVCLAHLHQVPDVELIDPSTLLGNPQNRPFGSLLFLSGRHKRVSELFFVALRVFFPVIELHRGLLLERWEFRSLTGSLHLYQQVVQYLLSKWIDLNTKLHAILILLLLR